jgi:signal transduction histidine kinase
MLAGILFLTLILAVAALITVDVLRTPTEAPAAQVDRHGPERATAGARSGTGVHAFSPEPAAREKSVPPAAGGTRFGTGPAPADSFDRPDEAARAFDQTRREIPRSATNEAALYDRLNTLFVNLSHRSQSLVERQLRLIEDLERGEQDQQRMANLSKLNRIAMRMHRNSQNLLVLAGNQPASGWNQPVTLAHLVKAALAEVEGYERVSFQVQPDIAVRGTAVNDLVHVLVELVENATSYSATEMPVHIKGGILTSGGALIEITDRGIGMTAKDMAHANQQLDNPPAADTDIPKWMGLLVVARLAARHGIRVRLHQSEIGGLTALVWLPDEIITHHSVTAPGHAVTDQRAATAASPTAFASGRVNMQAGPSARSDPSWAARSPQATVPADPLAAAQLSGSARLDAPGGNVGVVVPQAESQAGTRRLPIFDEVESHWSRGGHEAPGPAGPSAAVSPATPGLPRRPPSAAQGPRTAPDTPPSRPNRSGAAGRQGWPAPAEETTPSGQEES